MDETHKNYLKDLGMLIQETAKEAKAAYLESSQEKEAFSLGYFMACHRVVTLMQQQAEAFCIPLQDLCLEHISEDFFFVQKGSNISFKPTPNGAA